MYIFLVWLYLFLVGLSKNDISYRLTQLKILSRRHVTRSDRETGSLFSDYRHHFQLFKISKFYTCQLTSFSYIELFQRRGHLHVIKFE